MQQSHECTLTDQELIVACADWIQQLIDTGGKAFRMPVPARPNQDPDLLLTELVERFKDKLLQPQSEGGLQWVKGAPKERKQCHGRAKWGIDGDIHEAILTPIPELPTWWHVNGRNVHFTIHEDGIIEHLAASTSTANAEEGYWEVQYKNLWSLYQPLRDQVENENKEQQIAFAEWAAENRYHYDFVYKCWYQGEDFGKRIGNSQKLYELFLTETKQQ